MPVVTPRRASIETINAVPNGEVLSISSTIGGICNSARRSAVSDRQINPRPYLVMKLIAPGVTLSAAMVRSPSFSRSSSSTRMTILPCRISLMASSIVWNGIPVTPSLPSSIWPQYTDRSACEVRFEQHITPQALTHEVPQVDDLLHGLHTTGPHYTDPIATNNLWRHKEQDFVNQTPGE